MSALIRIDIACADEAEATRIAEALVMQRLAACCQTTPISSLYRWQGKVERGEEVRLSVKTIAAQFERIEAVVKTLHSYETIQIIATQITQSTMDYADWVIANSSG